MQIPADCSVDSEMLAVVFVAPDSRALLGLRAPPMAKQWVVRLRTQALRSRTVRARRTFLLRALCSGRQTSLWRLEAVIRLTPFTRRTRYSISSFLRINYRFSALTTRSHSFLFGNPPLLHLVSAFPRLWLSRSGHPHLPLASLPSV